MKLVGLVFLGLVASFAAGILFVMLFMLLTNAGPENIGEAAGMLVSALVITPLLS
jgi:hypothetical protein